jgi:hypothetical protein
MRTLKLIVFLFFVSDLLGQVVMPGISFQAVVRNADGTPMFNTNIEMKFSIRNVDAEGKRFLRSNIPNFIFVMGKVNLKNRII